MDKVLLQLENDYAADPKWRGYAQSNNYSTFLMLLKRNFLDKASERYEQNDEFFVRYFASKVELKEFLINEHPEWLELTVEKLTVTQTMIIVFIK